MTGRIQPTTTGTVRRVPSRARMARVTPRLSDIRVTRSRTASDAGAVPSRTMRRVLATPPIILTERTTRPISHAATIHGKAGSRALSIHARRSTPAGDITTGSTGVMASDASLFVVGSGSERDPISVDVTGAVAAFWTTGLCLPILTAVATGRTTISTIPIIPMA